MIQEVWDETIKECEQGPGPQRPGQPMRKPIKVLKAVAMGSFRPDATRSGMLAPETSVPSMTSNDLLDVWLWQAILRQNRSARNGQEKLVAAQRSGLLEQERARFMKQPAPFLDPRGSRAPGGTGCA